MRRPGGFFSRDDRLYVGRRDQTRLIAGLEKQVAAVRSALGAEHTEVPVWRALCFVAADFDLFATSLVVDGAYVVAPRALGKLLRVEGTVDRAAIHAIERKLALALPAA
jgi:hypothetical protein